MNIINEISQNLVTKRNFQKFKAGYNITVNYKIKKGNKKQIILNKLIISKI